MTATRSPCSTCGLPSGRGEERKRKCRARAGRVILPPPSRPRVRAPSFSGRGKPAQHPAPPFLRRRGPAGGGSGPGFGCGPGVVAGAAAGGSAAPSLVVCVGASSPSCCKAFSCRRDSRGPRGGRHQRGKKRGRGRREAVPPFVFLHQNFLNLQIIFCKYFGKH